MVTRGSGREPVFLPWVWSWSLAALLASATVACMTAACGEEAQSQGRSSASRNKAPSGAAPAPAPNETEAPAEEEQVQESTDDDRLLPEAAFIETDENRDPFRSFVAVFATQALPEDDLVVPRPTVLLEDVDVDQMRLVAIVSGAGGNPRAMVIAPDGKGWVLQRGDYVGRGERVRLGPGQPEREINWRVVRVRPDRIILVREDPVQAGPPVTRVMRLYPEEGS
jgi:type IV pilus assembly protein PilP